MKNKLHPRYLIVYLLGLLVICHTKKIHSQTLTLYAIPTPHPLNWHTPHQLIITLARNFISKKHKGYALRPLGHVVVELQNNRDTILTGMVSNERRDLFSSVFIEKYGMGVLFKLIQGRLERTENLMPEIKSRIQTGEIAFITYQLNDSSYMHLKQYIDSFQMLGYDKLYNGMNDPRHGTGSGCSAFGMSFLELINALEPTYKNEWTSEIAIQNKLIGGEMSHSTVSILKVFFTFRWAKEKTPHTHLKLYDPSLIYRWILKTYEEEKQLNKGKFNLVSKQKSKGLEIDCIHTCKPQYPIFINTPSINH